MVLWFHGFWVYGLIDLWFYGFMFLWFYGCVVLWFAVFFLFLWFCGFMVLEITKCWFHVCRKILITHLSFSRFYLTDHHHLSAPVRFKKVNIWDVENFEILGFQYFEMYYIDNAFPGFVLDLF